MNKGRLEAFSDGVIAIIITIMVLELKAPEKAEARELIRILPVFLSYVLSFIYVAIYWINYHHLFHAVEKVDAKILWSNLYLLFWLSLIPSTTSWMGENHIEILPVAFYGFVLLMCAVAYRILELSLIRLHNHKSLLEKANSAEKKKFQLFFMELPYPSHL